MSRVRSVRSTLVSLLAAGMLAGCAQSGQSGSAPSTHVAGSTEVPSSSTTPTPLPATANPTTTGVQHPTGASQVVLRLTEQGGLMFPEIRAIDAPVFTLYGDGTVIMKPASELPPPVDGPAQPAPTPAFRTALLDEAQVQALLADAVSILGSARASYELPTVMDAPTTTFFIDIEGTPKTVEAYGLGLEPPDDPDAAARGALKAFADRLRALEGQGETTEYRPAIYRAVLFESGPGVAPNIRPWPWSNLEPTDFAAPPDPSGLALPSRALTAEEYQELGSPDVGGGLTGIYVRGPDDKIYALALRPLLPDEPS